MDRLYPQVWRGLSKAEQDVLKKEFSLVQGGPIKIFNESVEDDGYRVEDLALVNVQTMMVFVTQDTPLPFMRMWELTLAKVKFILNPPVMDITDGEIVDNTPRKAPWCYYCEAKAFAHRPDCTRPLPVEEVKIPVVAEPEVQFMATKEVITEEIKKETNDTKSKQNKGSIKSGDAA